LRPATLTGNGAVVRWGDGGKPMTAVTGDR
jgi:hypothetical protein